MSLLSDWLFTSAFGIYMVAALLGAAEWSLTRYSGDAPRIAIRCGRIGVAFTVLGAVLHLASLTLRGIAAQRVPWGNLYEYMSAVGLMVVVAWLFLMWRHEVRRLSVFVLLPLALLLFIAGNQLYVEVTELQPALRSYWIAIHVAAAIMASAVFLLSGIVSGLHLWSEHRPAKRLPTTEDLDRVAYRTGAFGFVTLTFAIITGAVWAESAWGRFWGWDPKETVAFVSWVCYAAYLHARATAGWRGKPAAWINILGMIAVLFNLFFINLVITGLHSYAGTD
ncbi:c-type cytochrome biogenesis protein CcsB [Lentzea albidocapillata]|uniref:Cytochrome c-type biogenesis protein CcsB n=1 Tax=Lentzea albidocapillata TaxID=40571 RepID=A0A1W2FTY8_9PSEU|nr:c-type cytochrome biogenesis protein CcsB [Lentzea albidocapillata]SMD25244.1 cytochrome c-type biogenesis protein CcsB [Lentzea albidocapillata]